MPSEWNLPIRRVPVPIKADASIVWNNISVCYEQEMFGPVNDIAYSNSGALIGLVSTNQLTLLRVPQTDGVIVNDQSEHKSYSIDFRNDDKLYLESIDERVVVKSSETAFERKFSGHTRDVRKALFLNKHHFVSCSDDTTVRLWNMLEESELAVGSTHHDYVRALVTCDEHTFFSGSYDHTVNLWDVRTGLTEPVLSTENVLADVVESLCVIEQSNFLACANGDRVTIFDVRKGMNTPIHNSSIHTKPISSLVYSSKYHTLFTAALDGRVKMSSFDGNELLHLSTKKVNFPVTAIGVHKEAEQFAVGGASGTVVIFKVESVNDHFAQESANNSEMTKLASKTHDNIDNLIEAHENRITKDASNQLALQKKIDAVQQQLHTYQYNKALRTALYSRQADVIMSTIEELLRRGTLHVALNNQNDRTIVQLLRFASLHIDKTPFTDTMIAVIEDVIMIYSTMISKNVFLYREVQKLQKNIAKSLSAIMEAKYALSMMELIVDAQECSHKYEKIIENTVKRAQAN